LAMPPKNFKSFYFLLIFASAARRSKHRIPNLLALSSHVLDNHFAPDQ